MDKSHASIKKLPDTPGVYLFLGKNKEVLYVGKATSLTKRVKSYFSHTLTKTRGAHMVQMVEKAQSVSFRKTDSVLEALLLEASLIREFKPFYNTRDKDDKSFQYLVITVGERYPRLLMVRGKDLTRRIAELRVEGQSSRKSAEPLVYGPFPHPGQFKEALKIIRKIFPYYDTKTLVTVLKEKSDKKLTFNQAIGIYPSENITPGEYKKTIRYIEMLFEGKMKSLVRKIETDMRRSAREQKFERAGILKRQLFALQHIEDVSLIQRERRSVGDGQYRIEAYDVAHLGGKDTVGVMVVVDRGEVKKAEYRTFTIRSSTRGSDTGALKEMLERRLSHPEWQYPRLIVVDGGRAQINTAKKVLDTAGVRIPIVAVTKDSKHRPNKLVGPIRIKNEYMQDILLANAEAHRFALAVHKRKRAKRLR